MPTNKNYGLLISKILQIQLFDGDYDKATRAVGIFNAYCARCHTAGYSAGAAYNKKQLVLEG